MSYYGGGGPDWPMIGAMRRAEREASAARSDTARWRERAEELAVLVYEMADRTCPVHTEGDCQCRKCWESRVGRIFGASAVPRPGANAGAGQARQFWDLVNKISREAEARRRPT